MWQRDFTLVLNSATCDASCGGFFTETIHFTDSPMLFGSQEQAAATIPCNQPQQVRSLYHCFKTHQVQSRCLWPFSMPTELQKSV